MYLDNMTVLAIIMALVSTMTMTGVAVYKAHQWEQAYHDIRRKLKIEMAGRNMDETTRKELIAHIQSEAQKATWDDLGNGLTDEEAILFGNRIRTALQ